jgi:hypothetical protein
MIQKGCALAIGYGEKYMLMPEIKLSGRKNLEIKMEYRAS